MSKIIAFANQKGGVGKTTLADEVAFALERRGRRVGFVNMDAQGGAVHSSSMLDGTEDYVILDTPGALKKEFKEWCRNSDAVIFPTHASNLDLVPLLRCWDLAKDSKTKAKLAIAVNFYDGRRRADKDFMTFMANAEMPVWGKIPQATAFVQANAEQESVHDWAKGSHADLAIEELAETIEEEMGND